MAPYSPRLPSRGSPLGEQVDVALVPLDDFDYVLAGLQAVLERLGRDQCQVVGRSMVLRITAVDRARQAPHRQIESRRTQLTLVVAIG